MNRSKVLLKEIEGLLSKSSFASSILYPYDPQAFIFRRFWESLFTKFYLSQLSIHFPDFKSGEFPPISTEIYKKVSEVIQKNTKNDLLILMTPPNVEIIKICNKTNKKLPFCIYEHVISSRIVHARLVSEYNYNSPNVKFAHITMKMEFLDTEGQKKTQFNVFERRLDQKNKDSWRIGFIEDA
jgi:hypothetical protein